MTLFDIPLAAVMLAAGAQASAGIPAVDVAALARSGELAEAMASGALRTFAASPEALEAIRQVAADAYNRDKTAALQRALAQGSQASPGRTDAGSSKAVHPISTTSTQGEKR